MKSDTTLPARTMPTTTALAVSEVPLFRGLEIAKLAVLGTPPINTPVSREEWGAMSETDRTELLTWFADEEARNTEGVTVKFPRIVYPTSGSSFWEVPSIDGKPKPVSELKAVILEKAECRVYYDPENPSMDSPPICVSADCIRPDPESTKKQAEECRRCPHAQWGSGRDGRGQACKRRLRTYVLLAREDGSLEDIPMFISLPTTALGPFGDYVVGLSRQRGGLSFYVTELGLVKVQNKGGNEYSGLKVQVAKVDGRSSPMLTLTEARQVRHIRELYGHLMKWRSGKDLIEDIAEDTVLHHEAESSQDDDGDILNP